jgi:hypothetical protein
MAKTLGSWLRGRMDVHGLTNKDVAVRVHDFLVAAGLTASLETVATKLSKLLNGNDEGITYYFAESEPARLEALAAALGTTTTEIQERRSVFARHRTLVLDPRLPEELVAFLVQQQHDPAATYTVSRPPGGHADPALAIRAAMLDAERPLAVLLPDGIADAFRLTDLEVTTAEAVPRGYVLARHPDLVPIPPPRPLRLFDENDQPLIPIVADVTQRDVYHATGTPDQVRILEVLRRATAEGETASVPLEDAITWLTWRGGLHGNSGYGPSPEVVCLDGPRITLRDVLGLAGEPTRLWTAARQIYAVGPHAVRLSELLAPHHRVHAPPELDNLRKETQRANPWRIAELATKDDAHPLHRFASELPSWARDETAAWTRALLAGPTRNGRMARAEEQRAAAERFTGLAQREAGPDCLSILFVLARLQAASLLVIEDGDGQPPAYLADLGAGNLALVRLRETSAGPTPLVQRSPSQPSWPVRDTGGPYVIDAGDVVFSIVPRTNPLLEASTLTARRNRRVAASQDYDDGDDD